MMLAGKLSGPTGTQHLKNVGQKISLCPDLPPAIRPMKDELTEIRSRFAPALKKKAKMRYTPQWPFVHLQVEGQQTRKPSKCLAEVIQEVTGFNPYLKLGDYDLFVNQV